MWITLTNDFYKTNLTFNTSYLCVSVKHSKASKAPTKT